MKGITLFMLFYSVVFFQSCDESGTNTCQQIRQATDNPEMASRACQGDIAGALGESTRAPRRPTCPGCEDQERPRPSRGQPLMVSSIANPNCLTRDPDPADMQYLGVRMRGASDSERRATERFVSTVVDIAGREQARRILGRGSLQVRFFNSLRRRSSNTCLPGRQTQGPIDIARQCHPSSTTPDMRFSEHQKLTLMVHEAGHVVGNRGYYASYNRSVRNACTISKYCTHRTVVGADGSHTHHAHTGANRRNEEFAEVFSAFIYKTDRLRRECPQAYQYMRDEVFGLNGRDRYCR